MATLPGSRACVGIAKPPASSALAASLTLHRARGTFDNVDAYLAVSGFLFYSNLSFFLLSGGFDLSRGLWQYQFQDMRLLLLVVVPLLTMRSFAEERRLGTLELLWTYPLRDVEMARKGAK